MRTFATMQKKKSQEYSSSNSLANYYCRKYFLGIFDISSYEIIRWSDEL